MSSLFSLEGKVALVTGASSGLGRQFALALAREGAKVAIVARRVEKLEGVKAEVEALGAECFAARCDVMDKESIKEAVAAVKEKFGRIDILVNNAGVGTGSPAESMPDEVWEKTIDTNLNGVYYVAREVGKVMIEQNYGKIINIGSIHSTVAMSGSPISAYCASKGAVAMLTKALANEWAKHNITVNAIGPAYFESEMTDAVINTDAFKMALMAYCPMGRAGRPGELDGALIYFASDASSYTTGQLLTVDGGWTTI
ncbi:MAG: glucose 1-dehydrogenase [Clostridiales bacterium]|nr:glucose 1-dehydrogenase [Clostridiales bacterium]MBR2223205.1 glucose 1-dehydrogenase [Christensenellaceae bacterium]MBR3842467.1 glucose 1-dehydrogenase [Christensenellaceae bacterium]